jgi:glycerophosphoryl diester phosphodiesterase
MLKNVSLLLVVGSMLCSCNESKSDFQKPNATETKELSEESIAVRDLLSKDIIIAHRGTIYWAPEETEPAFRWARNIGADYLELDLQMTKDSILVAIHDNTILRTSNVKDVYPDVDEPTTNDFTLKELRRLDFGSWFNKKNPKRARESYVGTKILTFEDVIMIAQGYHIKKYENGEPIKEIVDNEWTGKYLYELDPVDNKNRPGVYAETKKLHLEKLLLKELKKYGWLITDNPKEIETYKGKVGYADTDARFVLQSFYRRSITELNKYLPGIPKCLLIWEPNMRENLVFKKRAKVDSVIKKNYIETINYCVDNNVEIMGSSITGKPKNYGELSAPWMVELIHKSGMIIHPYTFDGPRDFKVYGHEVDGVFTNRSDLALIFYGRAKDNKSEQVLEELGY